MKTTIILLFILPFSLIAQEFEKEKDFHFGVLGQYSNSSFHKNGLETSVFAEYKKHQLAIGTRPFFLKSKDYNSTIDSISSHATVLFFNFHYRYFLFDKTKRFNTFVQLSSEIYSSKTNGDHYYKSAQAYPVGPYFDYDFHAITASKGTFLNVYLSVGEEIKLFKGLFATANVGLGKIIGKSNYTITDADKNELVYNIGTDNKYRVEKTLAYTVSLGMGYRF